MNDPDHATPDDDEKGAIVLAATPIGNTADASPRLRAELSGADVIAAEDTRRVIDLARRLDLHLPGQITSYHDHNETSRTAGLVAAAQAGSRVLVVSDAGMPTVADPGYRIVQAAIDAGVPVSAVPGPSAVLTALAVSGLPPGRFSFEGFLPRKSGDRATALAALAAEQRTMVFFESPRRLADTLEAMAGAFGPNRRAAVCRELTKTYEEVVRAELAELTAWARDGVLGEVCVVVDGAPPTRGGAARHVGEVEDLTDLGLGLKDAARHVANRENLRVNDVYQAALQARSEPSSD